VEYDFPAELDVLERPLVHYARVEDGPACDNVSKRATLAQLVERLIRNQQVASSILAGGSMFSET
jgi:hypothetical protein